MCWVNRYHWHQLTNKLNKQITSSWVSAQIWYSLAADWDPISHLRPEDVLGVWVGVDDTSDSSSDTESLQSTREEWVISEGADGMVGQYGSYNRSSVCRQGTVESVTPPEGLIVGSSVGLRPDFRTGCIVLSFADVMSHKYMVLRFLWICWQSGWECRVFGGSQMYGSANGWPTLEAIIGDVGNASKKQNPKPNP